MSRRSLRPQLNQIRGWVRQGRTDAWIAHQLDVTVQQIQTFKREQDLEADGGDSAGASYDDVDLRAEDDAAIAAELEEEARLRAEQEAREAAARECRRLEQERSEGRAMLENFVATYGKVDEFTGIAGQISAFLAKPRKVKPCPPA